LKSFATFWGKEQVMSHLGERITEYIFEELSPAEMADARAHVTQCGECKIAVEHFQRTRSLLQAVPDMDLPRSAALTFEKPRAVRSWTWRWLAPMAVAAAFVMAVALAGPMHVQWQDSQLTIGFGAPQPQPPSAVEQQNAAAIQDLRSQLAYQAKVNEELQLNVYRTAASMQLLAGQRSSTVGD
jgi:anti-sigma factor RsiW